MRWFLFPLLAFSCRPPSGLPKDTPLDFAALPGPTTFSTDATIQARWNGGDLKTFWDSGRKGTVVGIDAVELTYVVHRVAASNGAVVLVPGRTEAMIKYAELAFDLNEQGYSTYALDVRGQGSSGRMLPNRDKGYVAAFDDYVADMHTFITSVVQADQPKDIFVLAHSMGGGIAVMYADEHPEVVRAMALSAPMLELATGGFPAPIASTLGLSACSATDGSGYAVGSSDYQPELDYDKNTVTSSEPRWRYKRKQLDDDASIRLGGVTWRWLCEALTATSRAQALGPFAKVPTLLFQAENDSFVLPQGQDRYCRDAARCQQVKVLGAKHEIFQERDDIRNLALSQTLKFFAARASP